MKSKLKQIWHACINIGITKDLDSREARRLSYLNLMTLLGLSYLAIRITLNLSNPKYAFILLCVSFLLFAVLILVRVHWYTVAKFYAVTLVGFATTIITYFYLGGFGGTYVVLFAILPFPFILFDFKQKAYVLTTLGLILSSFLLLIILQFVDPLPPAPEVYTDIARVTITLLTIIVILLGSWHLYSSNAAAEAKLALEKEKSEAANRAKSQFLANMSHELRTPLNIILGFSQLLARDSNLSREQLTNLETIGRSGEHLLSLINDVLELSKIEAGKIELCTEPFDLHQLLFSLEGMFRLRAIQKGLTLEFSRADSVPEYIQADRNKLSQVLINLLGNAVKFTERGGVTLDVRVDKAASNLPDPGDGLRFTVTDTGIGIPENEKDRIFDTFFQTEAHSSPDAGTGLGLPISRQFVKLMGGMIEVESVEGKGSRFEFSIPLEIADSPDKEAWLTEKRVVGLVTGQAEFRLLVAEDNPDNRKLLVTLLRSVGFEVREACNGREAIKQWQDWQPHLIWMDLRMPEVDGMQAIREIRKLPRGESSRIIALTAHAFEEDRRVVLENGADDFLRKPFTETDMFQLLEKHLGVQFQYAETCPSASAGNNTESLDRQQINSMLADLPNAMLARFDENVRLGNIEGIEQGIDEIRVANARLGDIFKKHADAFDYDLIISYLDDDSKMRMKNDK